MDQEIRANRPMTLAEEAERQRLAMQSCVQPVRNFEDDLYPERRMQRIQDLYRKRLDDNRNVAKQMSERELLEEIYARLMTPLC